MTTPRLGMDVDVPAADKAAILETSGTMSAPTGVLHSTKVAVGNAVDDAKLAYCEGCGNGGGCLCEQRRY